LKTDHFFRFPRMVMVGTAAAVVATVLVATNAAAQGTKDSTLCGSDGKDLTGSQFARMIADTLLSSGSSNVIDAKFLFQECYGGGILPDLTAALGNVKWIGGSAASAGQRALGDSDAVGEDAISSWTKPLLPQLKNTNQTLAMALSNASSNDEYGPNGTKEETPQTASGNGGDTIKLTDGVSHHAIIWTDDQDAIRHANNIAGIEAALTAAWGSSASSTVSITTVSTSAQLASALATIKTQLNPNEEFFFYATGHGGVTTAEVSSSKSVSYNAYDVESFTLSQGELDGMAETAASPPTVEVTYSGLSTAGSASLSLNGVPLGILSPLQTDMTFTVPTGLASPDNVLLIDNNSGSPFTLNSETFYTGAIDDIAVVPEPPTGLLSGAGLACLSLAWMRLKRRGLPRRREQSRGT
jgi:hypothetical protein